MKWLCWLLVCACGSGMPAVDGGMPVEDSGPAGAAPCPRAAPPGLGGGTPGLRCAEALFWQGFGLRWDEGPHPLARLGVAPSVSSGMPGGCGAGADLDMADVVVNASGGPGTTGATGTDSAQAGIRYAVVGLGNDPVQAVRVIRREVSVEIDPTGEGIGMVLIDLIDVGLSSAANLAVVLDGLDATTDVAQSIDFPAAYDPADGYATRGVGAWVAGTTRELDTLRVEVGARMAPARSDDAAASMAALVARTRVTVGIALVEVAIEPAHASVSYRIESQPVLDEARGVCPVGSEAELMANGTAGLPRGTLGITRFRFELLPDGAPQGLDLRELSLRLTEVSYDSTTGLASARLEGYATNEASPDATRFAFEGEVILLQWNGEGDIDHLAFELDVDPGRTQQSLPLSP